MVWWKGAAGWFGGRGPRGGGGGGGNDYAVDEDSCQFDGGLVGGEGGKGASNWWWQAGAHFLGFSPSGDFMGCNVVWGIIELCRTSLIVVQVPRISR